MAGYNIKQVENTFNRLIAMKICGDENGKNEAVDTGKAAAYRLLDGWSFSELDSFYENGVGENLGDDKYPIIVGYALITRFNLSYDEYVIWCRKQKEEYVYDLLKLVGIEDHARKVEKEKKEQEWKNSAYTVLAELVGNKKKIIRFTEENTELSLFGKNIKVDVISEKLKCILTGIKDAYQYGIIIFENEFEKRCTGFKEAYETMDRVLDDAREAQWVRLKSYLKKISVESQLLNEMRKAYIEAADFSYIKENLEKAYNNLLEQLGEKAQDLAINDVERKGIEFRGGGFGVKGAVMGMVGAQIANTVYEGLTEALTKEDVENTHKEFTKMADELFTGEETQKFCCGYIEAASKILRTICLDALFSDQMETATDVDTILEALGKYMNDLSGEDLRKLASDLICIYPHLIESYKFASDHFIGIDQELVAIAGYFGLENEISHSSRLVHIMQECIIFSDMQICKHNNGIVIDSLLYEGWKYKIEIPYISAFIEPQFWKYSMHDSIAKDTYMINQESGIIIRYWGGAEGKEVYDKEIGMTSAQILNQVNGWENFNVKDFSQEVEVKEEEEAFKRIIRGEMLYNEYHDVFMLTYCDQDAFFNICIGCKGKMGDNAETIEEIIHKIVITKELCSTKNLFFGCTKTEVLDIFQKEREVEAERYFKNHKEELSFAISFRQNFKILLDGNSIGNRMINKYDFEIQDPILIKKFEGQNLVGQYILYASPYAIITDFKILLCDKDGRLVEFMVNEVAEILPVSTNMVGDAPRLCIRLIDKNERIIQYNEKRETEYLFLVELINRSLINLLGSKVILYYKESQKLLKTNSEKIIFCTKCKKIAYVDYKGSILKDSYFCHNCGEETTKKNYIVKNRPYKFFKGNFQKRIAELSSESFLKPEDDIIKKYGLKEYSVKGIGSEQSNLLEAVREYIISMEGRLDYYSARLYRVLFSKFIEQFLTNEQMIKEYDYKLTDSSILLQTLKKVDQIGQYVLFSSRKIVLTDFYIYLCGLRRDYIYLLRDIVEIIPISGIGIGNHQGVCIHKTNNQFIIIEDDSLWELSKLLDCINIVLEESLKYKEALKGKRGGRKYYYCTYTNEKDEAYIYCPNCGTWTTQSKEGNVCTVCEMSTSKGYKIEKNRDIDAQKNNFKALFEGKIEEEIQNAQYVDVAERELEQLGIKLQEEREQEEECKEEQKRKKQEAQKIKYNAYIKEKIAERELHIKKELSNDFQAVWNNLSISIKFRKRFKALCNASSSSTKKFLIAQYGYYLKDEETKKFLEKTDFIHEYILYYDKNILLTDKTMYICALNRKYELVKLQEIACYENDGAFKVFIQYNNTRIPVKLSEMGNNPDLLLIINVSLDSLREGAYKTKYDQYKQCCCFCDSDSIKGGIVNWFCNDCGKKIPPSKIYINFWHGLSSPEVKRYREQVFDKNMAELERRGMFLDEKKDFEFYITCKEKEKNGIESNRTISSTIFCPYCGGKIERASRFCNFCGKENKYGKT